MTRTAGTVAPVRVLASAQDPAADQGETSSEGETHRGAPPQSDSSRVFAVLSYVFFPFALLALFLPPYDSEEFVRYHAMQSLALWGIGIVGGFVPCAGPFIIFVALVAGLLSALGAWGGDYSQIPVVSGFVSTRVWP
jgi:uncharacterized membrane protein